MVQRGRRDGRESGRKRERIKASSVKDEEGESREGPSKFRTENPKLDKTSVTGGRSMWLGRGEETGRASGMGEEKWGYRQWPKDK